MVAPPVGFPPEILARLAGLETALGRTIRGKPEVVRLSVVCLLARGHLLIEDVPGVGKTTLAQALARAVSCRFHRLQFGQPAGDFGRRPRRLYDHGMPLGHYRFMILNYGRTLSQ